MLCSLELRNPPVQPTGTGIKEDEAGVRRISLRKASRGSLGHTHILLFLAGDACEESLGH